MPLVMSLVASLVINEERGDNEQAIKDNRVCKVDFRSDEVVTKRGD